MHNKLIKVGADPELFARNTETRAFVSAHNLIPGTKAAPWAVNKGAVQVDGTALEFNIDAAHTADEFVTNITTVLQQMRGMIPNELEFAFEPAVHYPADYFHKDIPETAKELGCDPDFSAWTCSVNSPPDARGTMRTASGHLHIGWKHTDTDEEPDAYDQIGLVRQLDYYLGLTSLEWDPDPTRRVLYGKAGAYRSKPYGVEYRVLSNKWLETEALMRRVFDLTIRGTNDFFNGIRIEEEFGPLAADIIDNNQTNWRANHPKLSTYMQERLAV